MAVAEHPGDGWHASTTAGFDAVPTIGGYRDPVSRTSPVQRCQRAAEPRCPRSTRRWQVLDTVRVRSVRRRTHADLDSGRPRKRSSHRRDASATASSRVWQARQNASSKRKTSRISAGDRELLCQNRKNIPSAGKFLTSEGHRGARNTLELEGLVNRDDKRTAPIKAERTGLSWELRVRRDSACGDKGMVAICSRRARPSVPHRHAWRGGRSTSPDRSCSTTRRRRHHRDVPSGRRTSNPGSHR